MKQALRASFLAAPILAIVAIAACSDDPDPATYDVALSIVGNGRVVSAPAGVDCTGPSDCGTHTYTAGTAVSLTSTAATGYALSSVTVDGVTVTDATLHGGAGATTHVVVTFASTGIGTGEGDASTIDDAGIQADAGDSGADAGSCTAPDTCGTGSVCCFHGNIGLPLIAAPTTCETIQSCGTDGHPLCTGSNDTQHCGTGTGCAPAPSSPTGFACFPGT